MAANPGYTLIGCKNFTGSLKLAQGSRLVKSGRVTEPGPLRGRAQYAYHHADSGTWYQVTALFDDRKPPAVAARVYKLCEYVGSDCPCAQGKM